MKKQLTITIDESKFKELTEAANALHMKRSTYVETLIDRGRNADIPLEILLLSEFFDTVKKLNLDPEIRDAIEKPIKETIKLRLEGGDKNGKVQGNKKVK